MKISLRIAIPMIMLGSSLVIGLAAFSVRSWESVQNFESTSLAHFALDLSKQQSIIENALQRGDTAMAQLCFSEMGIDPEIELGTLLDADSKVIAGTRREWMTLPLDSIRLELPALDKAWIDSAFHLVQQSRQGIVRISSDHHHLTGVYPAAIASPHGMAMVRSIGAIVVVGDLRPWSNRAKKEIRETFLLYFLGYLLLALVLSFAIHRLVIRRLRVISSTVERFSRHPEPGLLSGNASTDELSMLQRDLATMGDSILSLLSQLELRNQEMNSFLRILSHDLRSPLVNIKGFLGELRHSVDTLPHCAQDPQVQDTLADIRTSVTFLDASATRLQAMQDGMMQFARLGRLATKMQDIDVESLVKEQVNMLGFILTDIGGAVSVGPLPPCLADHDQLNQVFSNLFDNAIKYRDPTRPLQIHLFGSCQGYNVEYLFQDNGLGIPVGMQESVFALFQRVNPHGDVPGDGIGLAIVRGMLARMGGSIMVSESAPGQGTTFRITLPAVDETGKA